MNIERLKSEIEAFIDQKRDYSTCAVVMCFDQSICGNLLNKARALLNSRSFEADAFAVHDQLPGLIFKDGGSMVFTADVCIPEGGVHRLIMDDRVKEIINRHQDMSGFLIETRIEAKRAVPKKTRRTGPPRKPAPDHSPANKEQKEQVDE